MRRTQGLLLVLASVVLLAWLAGIGRTPEPLSPRGPDRSRVQDEGSLGAVGERAARLRAHLSAPVPLAPSRRNLFQFGARAVAGAAGRTKSAPVSPAAETPPPVEARPGMQLLGIAEDTVEGRTLRTAIVSAAGQLFCVREGERVLGRYEVVRVGADAVELKEGSGSFTLALK